uniref:Reverse transcriptase/retrotransposon-derived protein RNase H-like domain-containing protein n=1 Tax=Ananas comosus var. bracteatus TaxID=296719 RepID=A0A6V7NQA3_ANACO|nr:unnamed protein product [Ananas comosus var. bracteatus]
MCSLSQQKPNGLLIANRPIWRGHTLGNSISPAKRVASVTHGGKKVEESSERKGMIRAKQGVRQDLGQSTEGLEGVSKPTGWSFHRTPSEPTVTIGAKKGNRFKFHSKKLIDEAEMAEGTRMREMNEHLHALEERMQQIAVENSEKVDEKLQQFSMDYSKKISVLAQQLDDMQQESARRHEQLLRLFVNQPQPPTLPTGTTPQQAIHQCGEEPREWSGKCKQHFRIYQIPEPQWVEVATMHFSGKTHTWKEGYIMDKPNILWEDFVKAVWRRFGGSLAQRMVLEFNKLTQTGSVEKYQERFEELRARMLSSTLLRTKRGLSEQHFIESYISGLKEELVPFIDLSHPTTLEEVYEQARLHEQALSILMRKSRLNYRATGNLYSGNTMHKTATVGGESRPGHPKGGSNQCGEKYHPGHQCANRTLHFIHASPKPDEVFDEQLIALESEEEAPNAGVEGEETGISVHALSGQNQNDTIKVQGEVGSKTVTILIDTGSTHSFIDFQVAKEVKAIMTAASPLIVTVANGHKVLRAKADCIEGIAEGSKALTAQAELKFVTTAQWYQAELEGSCCAIGQYCPGETVEGEVDIPGLVLQVLQEYEDVLQEPRGLPPQRTQDHKIPLQPGTSPVSVRPYSKPLTELLKKDSFTWNEEATRAFEKLKEVMTSAPVVAMSDYTKHFTVEVDACGYGIGAVLSQEGRPIAYISKAICSRNMGLSTYEKEFLAIVLAVTKWKHYLSTQPLSSKRTTRA